MSRPTLAVFAIVAIAVMMGAASVAPAYAAPDKKVYDEKIKVNDTIDVGGVICGESGATADRKINGHITVWTNGNFNFQSTIMKKFFDSDGEAIGHSSAKVHIQDAVNGGPLKIQDSTKVICSNGAPNDADHFGITIHKDGSVNFHS